jgi:hypothetical protein
VYVEPGLAARRSPRQLAIPSCGTVPSFDVVFGLAVAGAILGRSVLVVAMTELFLLRWQRQLEGLARPVTGLTLVDGRFRPSVDWKACLGGVGHDVALLQGAWTGSLAQSLSQGYIQALVDAVSAGLIVLA